MRPLARIILLALALTGCPTPPVCSPAETRCMADAQRVEVCRADGQWALVADCAVIAQQSGGEWLCEETRVDEGGPLHACMPRGETP